MHRDEYSNNDTPRRTKEAHRNIDGVDEWTKEVLRGSTIGRTDAEKKDGMRCGETDCIDMYIHQYSFPLPSFPLTRCISFTLCDIVRLFLSFPSWAARPHTFGPAHDACEPSGCGVPDRRHHVWHQGLWFRSHGPSAPQLPFMTRNLQSQPAMLLAT